MAIIVLPCLYLVMLCAMCKSKTETRGKLIKVSLCKTIVYGVGNDGNFSFSF